jgi:membrane-associated phospholipid phosphatase
VKLRSIFRALLAATPVLCAGIVAPRAVAQNSGTDSASATRAWVTKGDAVAGALAVVATVAFSPLDGRTARELQERRFQTSDDLQHTARELAFLGGPGPFVLSGSLFAAGHLARMPRVADVGLHMTEAVLIAASVTGLGKGIFGRALPSVNDSNPDNFQFFRGFHDRNGPFVSFPSGHTAASFAMASVVTAEVDSWHPGLAHIVGPIAYGGAGLVGLARLYQNVHWVSDLPLAAAIGTWSGITVVARSHRNTGQSGIQSDRAPSALVEMLRSTTVVPLAGHGTALSWSIPFELGNGSPGP